MLYLCQWLPNGYPADLKDELHTLSWFTDERGYDDEDRLFISSLEHGESVSLGMNDHRITATSINQRPSFETELKNWIPHGMTFIKEQTSIHTGGGCMLDVIVMHDGKVIAWTDEAVVVGPSLEAIMNDEGELPSICLVGGKDFDTPEKLTELGELL